MTDVGEGVTSSTPTPAPKTGDKGNPVPRPDIITIGVMGCMAMMTEKKR